jgi:hypothetical protein
VSTCGYLDDVLVVEDLLYESMLDVNATREEIEAVTSEKTV